MSDVQTKRLETASGEIFVRSKTVAGTAGLPVVLIHGAAISSRYMVPLLKELGEDFLVFAPDLPGYGRSENFDEIYAMLFSHGTESSGLAPFSRWKKLLSKATSKGEFLGVDEDKFPRDFGIFARYHDAVQTIDREYPMPPPLVVEEVRTFLTQAEGIRYQVDRSERAGQP